MISKSNHYILNNINIMNKAKKLHPFIIFKGKDHSQISEVINLITSAILSTSFNNAVIIDEHTQYNILPSIKTTNLHIITSDNIIPIDTIRNIKKDLSYTTNNFYKVIIIDSLDNLNISSQNALLKLLEEPPKNTLFLCIWNESNILETILSRGLIYKVSSFSKDELSPILKSMNIPIPFDVLLNLALCNFSYLNTLKNNSDYIELFNYIHNINKNSNISQTVQYIINITKTDKMKISFILDVIQEIILLSNNHTLINKYKNMIMGYKVYNLNFKHILTLILHEYKSIYYLVEDK